MNASGSAGEPDAVEDERRARHLEAKIQRLQNKLQSLNVTLGILGAAVGGMAVALAWVTSNPISSLAILVPGGFGLWKYADSANVFVDERIVLEREVAALRKRHPDMAQDAEA